MTPKRALARILAISLSIAASLAWAEAITRWLKPTPRGQIIRADRGPGEWEVTMRHGQPTWRDAGSAPRRHEDCPKAGTRDVVLLGTSITFGAGLAPEDSPSARLQADLDATEPGVWCVMDLSQPAYTGGNRVAELTDALETLHPDVVLWEAWGTDADRYTIVGTDAYNFGPFDPDAAGLPYVVPLPAPVSAWLFQHSRLYEYAMIALGTGHKTDEERWAPWMTTGLPAVADAARAGGAVFGIYAPIGMERAPETWIDVPGLPTRMERPWALAHDVPYLHLAEPMRGADITKIRFDTVGHLNAEGAKLFAGALADWLRTDLAPRLPQATPPS